MLNLGQNRVSKLCVNIVRVRVNYLTFCVIHYHFVAHPQRAFTILDMERTLPRSLRTKLYSGVSKMVCLGGQKDESRRFFRYK